MTRKKVKLNWIVNESARKASFKKRKAGLMKKVSELCTLCDINACIIIYNPDSTEPEMWPTRPLVEQLLRRFRDTPEMEKMKKMVNQETYVKERVGKIEDQLKKNGRKNKEMDVNRLMEELYCGKTIDEFNINELRGLIWLMEEKKKEIKKKVEFYQQVHPAPPESLHPPPPSPPQLPAPADSTAAVGGNTGGDESNPTDQALSDQWYINMMNNSENVAGSSSARPRSDTDQALAGSSGTANQMSLPQGNPRAYNIGTDMGVPNINIGISSRLGGNNDNLGLLQGNTGAASHVASSNMGLPSEPFGGSIAGSDVWMPYDVNQQWPHNFYP